MALNRAAKQCRSMLQATGSSSRRKFGTNATSDAKNKVLTAEWAPVMVLGGFTAAVLSMACHSMWQQLAYSPQVHLTKKKRGSMPEVYNPDVVVDSADKFVNRSFLRKVGNIQEKKFESPSIHDAYTRSREVESLKSVGVHKK